MACETKRRGRRWKSTRSFGSARWPRRSIPWPPCGSTRTRDSVSTTRSPGGRLSVPKAKLHRMSTGYLPQAKPGERLAVWDEPDGRFAADPIFPNSLVSTARDYMSFGRMLLRDGTFQARQFLAPQTVAMMMTDHL